MQKLLEEVLKMIFLMTIMPLGIISVVSLIYSFVMGALQIQEQTSQYLLKVVLLAALVWFMKNWFIEFAIRLFKLALN